MGIYYPRFYCYPNNTLVVVQYYPGVQSPVPLLTGPAQVDAATKDDKHHSNPHSMQAQSNVNIHFIILWIHVWALSIVFSTSTLDITAFLKKLKDVSVLHQTQLSKHFLISWRMVCGKEILHCQWKRANSTLICHLTLVSVHTLLIIVEGGQLCWNVITWCGHDICVATFPGPSSAPSSSSLVGVSSNSNINIIVVPVLTIILSAVIAAVIAVMVTRFNNQQSVWTYYSRPYEALHMEWYSATVQAFSLSTDSVSPLQLSTGSISSTSSPVSVSDSRSMNDLSITTRDESGWWVHVTWQDDLYFWGEICQWGL